MNPKHAMADTIPMIAPNKRAIFDFVGPERSRDIFKLKGFFVSCFYLNQLHILMTVEQLQPAEVS